MVKQNESFRDLIAFWIFGLANNFAYVIMLSAADDIIHSQSVAAETSSMNDASATNSSSSTNQCIENLGKPRCNKLMSTGAVLLADILPAVVIKYTFPFFMNRIPFGFRHLLVCSLQAASYLVVALSSSIHMSLAGVVLASLGSGMGEICYLALSSHYKKSSIAAWSSGTGGAGIAGALAYATLTEPKFFNMSPRNALLSMLVVPAVFAISYWSMLTPVPSVHKMQLFDPSTWIVPIKKDDKENYGKNGKKTKKKKLQNFQNFGVVSYSAETPQNCVVKLKEFNETTGNEKRQLEEEKNNEKIEKTAAAAFTQNFTFAEKLQIIIPLLRYMIPLSIVYFAEYLINSGLHQLLHFDCNHGFGLSLESQFRWYMALYQAGVFCSRTSVAVLELSALALYAMPFFQCVNLAIFYMQAVKEFIPHIGLLFLLTFVEGLFGGASYANTFNRIHKEAHKDAREFSLSIASSSDSVGISLAGFGSILIHNYVCQLYLKLYP